MKSFNSSGASMPITNFIRNKIVFSSYFWSLISLDKNIQKYFSFLSFITSMYAPIVKTL